MKGALGHQDGPGWGGQGDMGVYWEIEGRTGMWRLWEMEGMGCGGALGLGMHVDVGMPWDMKSGVLGNGEHWDMGVHKDMGGYEDMGRHWVLIGTWI